jgi:hypothetical protein
VRESLRRRLGALAHVRIGSRGAVPDRDDVATANEELGFTQFDVPIDQEGGAHDQEGRVTVLFQLRPLVRVERVLDREFVQMD